MRGTHAYVWHEQSATKLKISFFNVKKSKKCAIQYARAMPQCGLKKLESAQSGKLCR
jgi:hypothetical protein